MRKALLSADVHFKVAREFTEKVKEKCIGQEVIKSVTPGQQIIKIIHDELVELLGGDKTSLSAARPLKVMMVGLHGSGKTTTSAKLAVLLKKQGLTPALIACDVYRPAAIDQLEGSLSKRTRAIGNKIMDILVEMTVNIDYPDEDIEELTYEKLTSDLKLVIDDIKKLLSGAGSGKLLREGIAIGIVGMPNVGKSSLLNCLLRESRAIVTEIPGTTRDTIEEYMSIKGIPVKLTDTAGIRTTDDRVEKIGIQRSRKILGEADIVVFVADASRALMEEDVEIMKGLSPGRSLILLNKTDLEMVTKPADIEAFAPGIKILETSLISDDQAEALEDAIYYMVGEKTEQSSGGSVITNVRHENALREALSFAEDALKGAEEMQPLELIEIDVSGCRDALGAITGETTSADVIDEVFSRFCLGK